MDDSGKACISDFGLSTILQVLNDSKTAKNPVGTLRFMAPEAIKSGQLSYATDVYAYGMLIYEVRSRVVQ